MKVEDARSLFPVLQRFAYLNAGSLGPLSQATLDAMDERQRFDHEHGRGGRPWFESMFTLRTRVRELLAELIAAAPERLALTSSTTDGCNIVLSGLDLQPGDEVVTTDSEHPGLLLPLHASGARVVVAEVAARPTAEALEAVLACITPKTRLLALSHVLWTTGQVMPVHELRHESRLPVLVDGAQSVGAIPVDVGEIDFYTVSCQKWLCGPEPLGALYVRDPEALRVAIPSYFAQQKIERDGSFVPTDGAARFDSGWLPLPLLAGLQAALEQAPEWRFERAAEMTAHCRQLLAAEHELIGDAPLGTLVSFVPRTDPGDTALALYEQGVIVRELPGTGWMRASCGWWTNEDDLERLVRGLSAM
jgi:L-cysteine/cystine lyase